MNISQFYRETLGANFRNSRWSWGAVQPETNRFFLRVWKDDISNVDGREYVNVLGPVTGPRSAGYREREYHVEELRNGAEGFGVVCEAAEIVPGRARSIVGFDAKTLLRFGEIIERQGVLQAEILDRLPVDEIANWSTGFSRLGPEVQEILGRYTAGQREALVMARLGQGSFRSRLFRLWEGRCAVTGSRTDKAIRASHIKPWKACSNEERADPHNGLPLVATLDALFDSGLISFQNDGRMLVSSIVSDGERERLGLERRGLVRKPSERTATYLTYHRENVFVAGGSTE